MAVLVVPQFHADAEALHAEIEIHALGTLDADIVCDVSLAVVAVIE